MQQSQQPQAKQQASKEKNAPHSREEKSREEVQEERKRIAEEKKRQKEIRKAKAAAKATGTPAILSPHGKGTPTPPPPASASASNAQPPSPIVSPASSPSMNDSLPSSSSSSSSVASTSVTTRKQTSLSVTSDHAPTRQPKHSSNTPSSSSSTSSSISTPTESKEKEKGGGRARGKQTLQYDDPKKREQHAKKAVVKRTGAQKTVALFSHLPQFERDAIIDFKIGLPEKKAEDGEESLLPSTATISVRTLSLVSPSSSSSKFSASGAATGSASSTGHFSSPMLSVSASLSGQIHPAGIRLGHQLTTGTISGANARCIAMLSAFHALISDYVTPPNSVLKHDLMSKVNKLIRFLIDCRPQSIAMGIAITWFKLKVGKIDARLDDDSAKAYLCSEIEKYIRERIELAAEGLATHGMNKITDGDVIMTFGYSHSVEKILKYARDAKRKFKVIIVDARPRLEGKELLRRLVEYGIACTYTSINGIAYVISEVSKVMVGAAACLANGSVASRCGTAVLGMLAHHYRRPFLVCCETFKFHQRAQVDSICKNELGDPDELIKIGHDGTAQVESELMDWRDMKALKLLDLVYDVTPVEFVTMIITEVGLIPPSSVPVILREASVHSNEEQYA